MLERAGRDGGGSLPSWGSIPWQETGAGEGQPCTWGVRDSIRENSLKLCQGGFLGYQGEFLHQKGCQAVAQAAQSSVGVRVPGSGQKCVGVALEDTG